MLPFVICDVNSVEPCVHLVKSQAKLAKFFSETETKPAPAPSRRWQPEHEFDDLNRQSDSPLT